jgi:hypothetical protein
MSEFLSIAQHLAGSDNLLLTSPYLTPAVRVAASDTVDQVTRFKADRSQQPCILDVVHTRSVITQQLFAIFAFQRSCEFSYDTDMMQ